jgi:CRISPR/Cas system-associated exonuclease Cas4 (RecB family)
MDEPKYHPELYGELEVVCEKSGETVTGADCYDCSKSVACYPSGLIKLILEDALKERNGTHVTDLTGCLRKAFYTKTQPRQPIELREMLNRMVGTIIHKAIEEAEADPLKVSVAEGNVSIVGTTDGGADRLTEIKTTRWIVPDKLPYGNHEEQVKSYLAMRKKMGIPGNEAVIYYMDLSGPYKCPTCKQLHWKCKCGRDHSGKAHSGVVAVPMAFTNTQLEDHLGNMLHQAALLQAALEESAKGNPDCVAVLRKGEKWECGYCEFAGICRD